MDVIQNLTDMGIINPNSKSVLFEANQHIISNYRDEKYDRSWYEQKIESVFGVKHHAEFRKEAEVIFCYMASEATRLHADKQEVDANQVYQASKGKFELYMNRFPWVRPGWTSASGVVTPGDNDAPQATTFGTYSRKTDAMPTVIDENIQLKTTPDGKKPAKGAKAAGAKAIYEANKDKSTADIIAMFVSQLAMSPMGARTYLYNLRKAEKQG